MIISDQSKSIEIYIPNREAESDMCAQLSKTLQTLQAPDTEEDYTVRVNFSYKQPADANRNSMVKEFLDKPNAEWMLMIDADCAPQRDILKMVEFDKSVISAITPIKKDSIPQPVILEKAGEGFKTMPTDKYYELTEDNEIIEVDGVGTGCLLVRRDVFEQIKPPWFKFLHNEYGGLQLGEDFYFSRKLRENDIQPYVCASQLCSHYKKIDMLEYLQSVAEERKKAVIEFAKQNGLEEYLDDEMM